MTKKWEVVVYTEKERIICDSEEKADEEADYQNRTYGALTRIWPTDIDDEDSSLEES